MRRRRRCKNLGSCIALLLGFLPLVPFLGESLWHREIRNQNVYLRLENSSGLKETTATDWMEEIFHAEQKDLSFQTLLNSSQSSEAWSVTFPVAVKIFKERRKIAEDALHEIALTAGLHHRGLVQFVGLVQGSPPDPVGYVMEYFNGTQLEVLLDELSPEPRPPVPLRIRLQISKDIAEALAYLHAQRLIHFDVKPEQILVKLERPSSGTGIIRSLRQLWKSESGADPFVCSDCRASARLIDYGTALRATRSSPYVDARLENGRRWRGTEHYLAPEMVINNRNVTRSVDVYGYGVVLWELCARQYPYRGTPLKRVKELIRLHRPMGLEIPAMCEPEWRDLIMECMEWRPEDRPTFEQIAAKLDSYLNALPATGTPVTSSQGLRPGERRAVAGLYTGESSLSAAQATGSPDGGEVFASFGEICSTNFSKLKAFDALNASSALKTIRSQFPQFRKEELLDGTEKEIGSGIYGNVYLKNLSLVAKIFKGPLQEGHLRELFLRAFLRHSALLQFFGLIRRENEGDSQLRGVLLEKPPAEMVPLETFVRERHPLERGWILDIFRQLLELLVYLEPFDVVLNNLDSHSVQIAEKDATVVVKVHDLSQAQCQADARMRPQCSVSALHNCQRHPLDLQSGEGTLQFSGQQSDLHSACALVFQMCTDPVAADSEAGLQGERMQDRFDIHRCGASLRDLLLSCMEPQPLLRTALQRLQVQLTELQP